MSIPFEIKVAIESHLGASVVSAKETGGGCIADSKTIKTSDGRQYLLKLVSQHSDICPKEGNGLRELAKSNSIKVPGVILANNGYLLLDFIERGAKPDGFFENFGRQMANMHRSINEYFGFYEDNYIGFSPQYNVASGSEKSVWSEFYFQKRLMPQMKMAEENGCSTPELRKLIGKLENKLDFILSGSHEAPTLLHGDLWSGNYMCTSHGEPVLIDPAVYYGHREADLAMTKMFGGFNAEFYESYRESFPLPDGWEYRQHIYLLYHCLNHLNLFGSSYYRTCIESAAFYL